jgi:SIR2-like domain
MVGESRISARCIRSDLPAGPDGLLSFSTSRAACDPGVPRIGNMILASGRHADRRAVPSRSASRISSVRLVRTARRVAWQSTALGLSKEDPSLVRTHPADLYSGYDGGSTVSVTQAGDAGALPDRAALQDHYGNVVRGLHRGRVTPVLGAGVNLCGRNECGDQTWFGRFPPSAAELTAFLAGRFELPSEQPAELLRVSQYIYEMRGGEGPLFDELHDLFAQDYRPTEIHEFLAGVPAELRRRGIKARSPLIVTTNYDDLMERALRQRGEEFDLLVYMANGPHEGLFCHRAPGGELNPIDHPEELIGGDDPAKQIDPARRTVMLKLHGYADQENPYDDSYVITEDHYIEYLARIDLDNKLPQTVLGVLRNSHLLFLGYGLRDWNLKAMLYKLWTERLSDRDWWAVQLRPDPLEVKSWRRRGVEIFDLPLDRYVAELRTRFGDSLAAAP